MSTSYAARLAAVCRDRIDAAGFDRAEVAGVLSAPGVLDGTSPMSVVDLAKVAALLDVDASVLLQQVEQGQ